MRFTISVAIRHWSSSCHNTRADEFKKIELLGKYTAKLLCGWDNKKFEEEYLKKLERNWNRWKNNRRESEEEYMKKLEKSIEWNKIDEQISRVI